MAEQRTSSQIYAQNLAQTGGVPAQLQMGRDRQQMALAQMQREDDARRLAQAMQLAEMNQAMQQQRMNQDAQQFGMQQQRLESQFGQQQGLREQQFEREQALFDFEQQQRDQEQAAQAAMGSIYEGVDLEATSNEFLKSDIARAIIGSNISPDQKARLLDEAFDRWASQQRAAGGGATASGLQVASRLDDLDAQIAATPPEDTAALDALWQQRNNLTGASKMFDRGFVQGPGGGGIDPAYAEYLRQREGSKTFGAGEGEAKAAPVVEESQRLAKAETAYKNFSANSKALFDAADRLYTLADAASYSKGQAFSDATARELAAFNLGDVGDGAVAKATYENIVKTEILPTLKSTLGAQFTAIEGKWLMDTLGDINLSGPEKKAQIQARVKGWRNREQVLKRLADPNYSYDDEAPVGGYSFDVGGGSQAPSDGGIDYKKMYGLE